MKATVYYRRGANLYTILFGYVTVSKKLVDDFCNLSAGSSSVLNTEFLNSLKQQMKDPGKKVVIVPYCPGVLGPKKPGRKEIIHALLCATMLHPDKDYIDYPKEMLLYDREIISFEIEIDQRELVQKQAWKSKWGSVMDQALLFLFLNYIT